MAFLLMKEESKDRRRALLELQKDYGSYKIHISPCFPIRKFTTTIDTFETEDYMFLTNGPIRDFRLIGPDTSES